MREMSMWTKRVCGIWKWMLGAKKKNTNSLHLQALKLFQYKFCELRSVWNVQHIWLHCFISCLDPLLRLCRHETRLWLQSIGFWGGVYPLIHSILLLVILSTLSITLRILFVHISNASNYKYDSIWEFMVFSISQNWRDANIQCSKK